MRGPKGSRTLHARLARRRCAPALCPYRRCCCAGSGGFEPPRVGSEPTMLPGCISSQRLSKVERPPRVELGCSPWRGDALPLCYSRELVLRRPCGIRTRSLQVEGLARSPLLQRSLHDQSEARESNAVTPAPNAGGLTVSLTPDCVPSRCCRTGRFAVHCGVFKVQVRPNSGTRRGGRSRTHYLRFWRPACNRVHLTPLR